MTKKIPQTLRGVRDILPEEQPYWLRVEDVLREVAMQGGYERITLPTIESADLFIRSVGEATDVVAKEMYIFKDKSENEIALRPEGTASVVRAYIEHGMKIWPKPIRLYYYGPMFRYDRPQAGRYREFYQLGFEMIGDVDPVADAQMIAAGYKVLTKVGLKGLVVRVNSLGSIEVQAKIAKQITKFLTGKKDKFCEDCQRRAEINPMRVLDCKEKNCRAEMAGLAEVILNNITEDDRKHFMSVLEYLDELKVPYVLDSQLVRGLDYYTRTVFEYTLENDTKAVGGGGRYDNLIKQMGGDLAPAVGLSLGVDRVVEMMQEQEVKLPSCNILDAYLAQLGDKGRKKAIRIVGELENEGFRIAANLGKGSIKAQLAIANRLGAPLALIIGEQEVHNGTTIIRDMTDGTQEIVVDKHLEKRLAAKLQERRFGVQ